MEEIQHDDWTPDPTEHREPESGDVIARRRAVEIAQDARFCMVTSTAGDGALHARPMTPQQVTDDLEAWFPDGPQDPDLVLLRVVAESAEYWKAPGGRAASLLGYVKANATGEPMRGESGTVRMD